MKEACKLPLVFFGYLEYSKIACNKHKWSIDVYSIHFYGAHTLIHLDLSHKTWHSKIYTLVR